jgi:hypothetical protein
MKFKKIKNTEIELVHHFPESSVIIHHSNEKQARNYLCLLKCKKNWFGGAA